MGDDVQKGPFIVARTYHTFTQTKGSIPNPKNPNRPHTYVISEESEVIYPPHPNARFEIAQWLDNVVPWDGEGTVRILWKIDLDEEETEEW